MERARRKLMGLGATKFMTTRARGITVADTIGQICQNVPGCEPDPDHDPFKYVERLGPPSPPQTLPQPLPQPLNRRNLRFGYKEDVFCPEGCKPKED